MEKEQKNIRNKDWRLQAITTLAKEWKSPFTGIKHDKGCPVMLVAHAQFNGSDFQFGMPSMTALFLDYSSKLWEETNRISNELANKWLDQRQGEKMFYVKNHLKLFSYFQKRMGAIVFAYSALESFANEQIPDNFTFQRMKDDKKCSEIYNKQQIENNLSLDIKLSEILPAIMKVRNPKGVRIWDNYLKLKDLRDRIIHMKTRDRKSLPPKEKTIWGDLLNTKEPNYAYIAKNIISFYFTNILLRPRWFEKFLSKESR